MGGEPTQRAVPPRRYHGAVQLQEIVAARARVEGDLVMVDEFLNHRIEPSFIRAVGRALAERFRSPAPGLILTSEASGIPPALACGLELEVPVIYAKKFLGTGNRYSYFREVMSATKGIEYRVEVARRVLPPGRRVLVLDDFLSAGRTAEALGEITIEAGCDLVGFGFVIEKAWCEGRGRLLAHGWDVDSLVVIEHISGGRITFRDVA
jgi:xanthine phosphoribosyltransferase